MIMAIAVKATAAMVVAIVLLRILRRAPASLRHSVIAATFGAMLFLPLASLFIPAKVVTYKSRVAPASSPAFAGHDGGITPSGPRHLSFIDITVRVYIAGAALFLVSLLAGIVRLHRIARGARRADGNVATSPELAVPLTFGWLHPIILLPADSANWSEGDLARVIRHELEHIARADWITQIICRVACAIYWPHPLTWMLWRRLRLEAERACDDAVIRTRGDAETYAEQLVSLARRLAGSVPAPAMAAPGSLGRRVEAILDGNVRRAPMTRTTSLIVAIAAMICMVLVAPVKLVSAEEDAGPLEMALFNAAKDGDIEAVRRHLDLGANANAAIEGDGSPLIAAARGGHLEAVRLLLDRGADIDRGVPGDGNALIMAAGEGQTEVVRYLLERGAAIEEVVPGDENPLIHASERGQAAAVRLLIARGANVNARVWAEGEWRTPLNMARRNHRDEVVRVLREGTHLQIN
jgi:beta-lactamase regulating signal transducer with metallopeptidase domain